MKKKIAIVTGSSKGIGKAIAQRLGREGYYTYVTYHNDKNGGKNTLETIQSMGGAGTIINLDVRSEESVARAFMKIKQEQGQLNILINNAGIDIAKNIEDMSYEEWRSVTETHIDGSFLCTKHALPLLKVSENPNVIFITSSVGERPNPDYVAYCIGKAGLNAFAKAMALYLSKYGIRTNAISAGETQTPMWGSTMSTDHSLWKRLADANPMGRVATVEDIANAVMYLINDPLKYLNGNFIFVNGGHHLE